MAYVRKKYTRSEGYRTEFIRNWPPKHGKYRCVYCGRKISKDNMEVDHVIPVYATEHSFLARIMVPPDGVNSLKNLVPACHKCNNRKGKKCGLWLIRGKFWKICLPIYCILRITAVAIIATTIFIILGYDRIPAANMLLETILSVL